MRTFGLKVLIVVVAALVGTAVIHSLVYLSIDPGSLSAQMPRWEQYRVLAARCILPLALLHQPQPGITHRCAHRAAALGYPSAM
jgi:hypothetical protein